MAFRGRSTRIPSDPPARRVENDGRPRPAFHEAEPVEARESYRRLLVEGEALRLVRPGDVEPIEAIYSAHHGLGSVAFFQGGGPDLMIADYELSLSGNRELLDRFPDQAKDLRNLSRTTGMLAQAYRAKGRPDDAGAASDLSYQATRRLVTDHPDSQDYRFALASLERGRGSIPLDQSLGLTGPAAMTKLDQARQAFRRAIAIDRGLIRENPLLDAYRTDLIDVLKLAYVVESGAGRGLEGLALLREASEVGSSLANPAGDMAYLKPAMVEVLVLTAYAYSEDGRADEALKALDEADRLLGSLTPAERSVKVAVEYRDYMIAFARAMIDWDAGRMADSLKAWDRACELAPPPSRPLVEYLREIHQAEASLGPAPEAARGS